MPSPSYLAFAARIEEIQTLDNQTQLDLLAARHHGPDSRRTPLLLPWTADLIHPTPTEVSAESGAYA